MLTRRLFAAAAGASVLVLVPLAGSASAHVSVQAPGATQGGYTTLTFRVPTEKDIPTVKVELAMPTDTPIASIRLKPKQGWTYKLTKAAPAVQLSDDDGPIDEIVTRVVWTATDAGIKPNEFDEFEVSAGPLPKAEQIAFKVLQTYSDGSVASWIEEPTDGADEPEYPAPVLVLAPATSDDAHAVAAPASSESSAMATQDDDGSSPIPAVALVIGILALLLAGFAVVSGRRAGS